MPVANACIDKIEMKICEIVVEIMKLVVKTFLDFFLRNETSGEKEKPKIVDFFMKSLLEILKDLSSIIFSRTIA